MTPEEQKQYEVTSLKIMGIFFPNAFKEISKLKDYSTQLIHYTSAENALNIIKGQSLWLRNARTMNDWSEVEHGYNLLRKCLLENESKQLMAFKTALDGIGENDLGNRVITLWDKFLHATHFETYIASLSKIQDTDEALDGRLSMWRAYGSDISSVAIILKTPPVASASPLNIILNPVAYADDAFMTSEISQVIENISNQTEYLKTLPDHYKVKLGYMTLLMSAASLKHIGFKEENEWRLIYAPVQLNSKHVSSRTESIRGVPQKIYTLDFKNNPEEQINNISFPELFDSIIVTQSPYNSTIIGALREELIKAGVQDVDDRIRVSRTPYRKN